MLIRSFDVENNSSAAAQPGSQPAAQPAQQYSPPSGYALVSDSDLQAYRRHEQSVRGFQPFYERANKLGIKSAVDLDKWAPAIETLSKRKMDPKALAAMFSDEAEQDLNRGGGSQPQNIDLAKLREEMKSEIMGDVYTMRHQEARQGDAGVIEKAVAKVLGDGEHDDFNKELTKRAVKDWLEENRPTYPDGHPLAGKYLAPLTQDLADKVAEYMTGLRAKQAGATLADKAAQAAKPVQKVGTVGGGGGSTGKPNTKDTDMRAGGLPPRAAVEAAAARIQSRPGRR